MKCVSREKKSIASDVRNRPIGDTSIIKVRLVSALGFSVSGPLEQYHGGGTGKIVERGNLIHLHYTALGRAGGR